jgi:hypothetical protein
MGIILGRPSAKFFEKTRNQAQNKKNRATQKTKKGHFKRGNGGDILKELDKFHVTGLTVSCLAC